MKLKFAQWVNGFLQRFLVEWALAKVSGRKHLCCLHEEVQHIKGKMVSSQGPCLCDLWEWFCCKSHLLSTRGYAFIREKVWIWLITRSSKFLLRERIQSWMPKKIFPSEGRGDEWPVVPSWLRCFKQVWYNWFSLDSCDLCEKLSREESNFKTHVYWMMKFKFA